MTRIPLAFTLDVNAVLPPWFIALLAAALVVLLVHGSRILRRKNVPARWVGALAALRAAIIVVLVLALLQPVVSYLRSTEESPDLLVLVDTSKSMGTAASADGSTRLDAARATLRAGGLLDKLGEQFNVRLFAFDRDARPIGEAELDRLAAEGESTRLGDSLATAVAYRRQGDSDASPAAAAPPRVLLVSDGDDLGREDVVQAAQKLGVVIDTLALDAGVGPPVAPAGRKIAIAAVQSPRSVKLGSETQIAVTLRAEGGGVGAGEGAGGGGPARQVLLVEDGETLASQAVTFAPGQSEQVVRLSHRPNRVGLRKYELRLADEPAASASAPYAFSVGVVDDKHQVLLLEDSWRWEVKFLRRVIEDDPSFSFTALLPRGAGGGMHTQLAEADRRITLAGFPQGGADLSWFDTIILGDVAPRRWPPALAAGLAQMVRDEGKSLVVIAGPNLASLAESPALHALLPVEVTRESAQPIEGPIEVRPSREGVASPFFNIPGGGALPPLDRVYPPLRKRPAATILLEAPGRTNAYGNLIVAAEHTVGRGRVLFIGTDALWNWQLAVDPDAQGVTPYAAFWQHALRALAPAHPRTGAVTLSFQPERSRYRAGDRVVLRARYTSSAGPLEAPTIRANVTLPGGEQVPLAFDPDPMMAGRYRAEFEATRPGQYTVPGGIGPRGQPAEADALAAIDVEPARDEADSPAVDTANLARIAEGTRGRHVNPSDPSTWPTPAEAAPVRVEQVRTVDLWGNLSLMILLCALLGTDWFLRLIRGYV